MCKTCRRVYSANHYRANKAKYRESSRGSVKRKEERYREYKSGLCCLHCGETYAPCLEFHHRDPLSKKGTVSDLLHRVGWDELVEEMAKCDVLCSNCHSKLHHGAIEN